MIAIMMGQAKINTRLCPHCANSIGADALTCPYCKADLLASAEPEWPERAEEIAPVRAAPKKEKLTVKSKAILVLGLLVFALGVYLVGGNLERNDLRPVLAQQQKALQEKDQKIQTLESELAQLRKESQGAIQRFEESKARLDESQKTLAAAQRKLTTASREIERLSANRVASAPRPAVRTPNSAATSPTRTRSTGNIEPRTYETVRSTPVYEEPANSARVVAQITKGTEITVVGSNAGWLEIRSKHGKPPGFIRADDAMFVSRSSN
jgi:hypothetical protein